ncbi:hypothetical protein R69658_07991 [Paraburkholderia aspalathi]|uniref:PNPLA domain-containing protein n=1 Tax=Paraburkholderia aspalathi TaxID=1324617 RepID=A0ABM8T8H0_9BURK|nr:patatin-like phospholipase family protein [Paraburkholderia aspalathi]MBK3824229.1 patatin-like phospholipase family protein [Paraburkholderia aspalathi]MBK3836073.1 patatin-like phospholipase family protein [Paraburkholderia aspalathi]MBK3865835.1 patatin-like phospholipase family protein [Paraburkholderia aspalathi]CAE6868228.1 hypothetical protein R69658_07991 [Paraburkholderia aspalathi]
MKWLPSLASTFAIVAALSGCSTGAVGTPSTTVANNNEISTPIVNSQVCSQGTTANHVVFFLTISGGGSRAAYFGAEVISRLQNFDDRGSDLAKHINVVSSVSGGSITAALYGISRDEPDPQTWRPVWNAKLIRKRLAANLKIDMAEQLANPKFLLPYLFGRTDRTDALAEALDSDVFFDRMKSSENLTLGNLNPERPQIIFNATNATAESTTAFRPRPFGSLFTFSKTDLESIGVDYATMPLSRAVAASAAFPGLLSPVVLNRYRLGTDEMELHTPRYIHLIDGGNVDNLGLLAVKRALVENSHRLLADCDQVVVVTVDAFGAQGFHRDSQPKMRSAAGWFIDDNTLLSAFDALLAANRTRLLAEFKSRTFVPPADSEQCRKDDLPADVCLGGVRVNWDEVNALLKKKLFFVHISFDSEEIMEPPVVTYCQNAYLGPGSPCVGEDHDPRYYGERAALLARLKHIPTTFGLSQQEQSDISTYVHLFFNPQNECLLHLRDLVAKHATHTSAFYNVATNSCDETTSDPAAQQGRVRAGKEIFGDAIPIAKTPGHIEEAPSILSSRYVPLDTVSAREAYWQTVFDRYGWLRPATSANK